MKISPLQLDEAFIGDVSVKPHEGTLTSPGIDDLRIDATPSYARNAENPLKWLVKLSVDFRSSGEKPVSYEGHIKCEGHFTVLEANQPEQRQRKLVAVNAATILYSTAREVVATITARGRNGKFLLPSVSFIDQTITFPDDPVPEDAPTEQAASAPIVATENPPSGNAQKDVS
jgi:preprotein translocase subunit SecB